MTLIQVHVCVDDLGILAPDGYRELIDGRLIDVPGIGIELLLTLDRAVAARTAPGPADKAESLPAVIFVGPLPFDDGRRDVDRIDYLHFDQEAEDRRFQALLQGARIYAAPGLRHWWWAELTVGGNLRLTAYSADSFTFPRPYLSTDYLPPDGQERPIIG